MEEQKQNDIGAEAATERSKNQVLPGQSISSVDELKTILVDSLVEEEGMVASKPKPTEEDRINEIASEIVRQAMENNRNGNSITLEEQEKLLERTKRQVRGERQKVLQVLEEAEQELKTLQWNDMLPAMMDDKIKGVNAKYIIHFGNFVQATNGWIYRPTAQQMLSVVRRYKNKKVCEQIATNLRKQLKNKVANMFTESPKVIDQTDQIESDYMKQLKSDLAEQIKQLRESV